MAWLLQSNVAFVVPTAIQLHNWAGKVELGTVQLTSQGISATRA